jgi:hypothetical protein
MKKKSSKAPIIVPRTPENLTIKNAGILAGKFKIELSNGDFLEHVTEIITTKPSYQDGVELKITVWVENKKPLTVDSSTLLNK